MRELLRAIRNEVDENWCGDELKNVEDKNIRLRGYDSRLKILQKPYEDKSIDGQNAYDMTVLEHNFHSYFELKIEIREEGAEFLEWNENWVYVRPWTWEMFKALRQAEDNVDLSGESEESKEALENLTINIYDLEIAQCGLVRLDMGTDTIADLEEKVAEHTSIPATRLIIMMRNEPVMSGGEVLCDHYNMEWARGKKLNEMRKKLVNGNLLFVEEGDASDPQYFNKLYWQNAMKNEGGLMKLHINTSAIFGDDNQIADSAIQISIGKTKSLAVLKAMISKKISIPVEEFTIRRNNVQR